MIDKTISSLLDSEQFYCQWIQRLNEAIEHGHHIYFIYNSTFDTLISDLKNFFLLNISDQYHGYFFPRTGEVPSGFNLCIIEGVLALTDFTYVPQKKKPVLFSFTHPEIILRMESQYLEYLKVCKPLSSQKDFDMNQLYLFLRNQASSEDNSYIYDELPFLFPLNIDDFAKILYYNGFSPAESDQILKKYQLLFSGLFQDSLSLGHRRIMLNFDMLEKNALQKECAFIPHLISNKTILIPQKYYLLYLREILRFLLDGKKGYGLELAFTDASSAGNCRDIMVFSSEELFTYLHTYTSEDRSSILFTNPSITFDAFDSLDQMWNSLPEENRNQNLMIRRVKKLVLQLAEVLEEEGTRFAPDSC